MMRWIIKWVFMSPYVCTHTHFILSLRIWYSFHKVTITFSKKILMWRWIVKRSNWELQSCLPVWTQGPVTQAAQGLVEERALLFSLMSASKVRNLSWILYYLVVVPFVGGCSVSKHRDCWRWGLNYVLRYSSNGITFFSWKLQVNTWV